MTKRSEDSLMKMTTFSELFNLLFPTEYNGSVPGVRSSAVPDEEFDEMPNSRISNN
jgi:hypothetical protein